VRKGEILEWRWIGVVRVLGQEGGFGWSILPLGPGLGLGLGLGFGRTRIPLLLGRRKVEELGWLILMLKGHHRIVSCKVADGQLF
jgi:hypothetical protein